jgi:activating signal cointegrator complex subunit 3
MIGRAGRPQFDDKGVAIVYCEASKKNFYRKFLNDPFPIESSLQEQLEDHINAEIARGEINNATDCIEWITWSFMFRRVLKNPNYYSLEGSDNKSIKEWLTKTVKNVLSKLKNSKCIEIYEAEDGETYVMPTELGFISSMYYLKHSTVNKFYSEIS